MAKVFLVGAITIPELAAKIIGKESRKGRRNGKRVEEGGGVERE